MALVVTALRALLNGATAAGVTLECSPEYVARVVAASSHDPHLLSVALGVLWARANECGGEAARWQQGSGRVFVRVLAAGAPRRRSVEGRGHTCSGGAWRALIDAYFKLWGA